jgi:chemotaxis protein histidine kinase CheA
MSAMSVNEFNAQLFVSEQLTRQLVNASQDLALRCVKALAEKYNFDADEAIRMLGISMIKLERKAPIKTKSQAGKTAKVQMPKAAYPLPYSGEFNDACCYALRQNNGLYTQCTGVRKGEAQFCKGCASQLQKTGAEMPEYGTIQQRMAVDIFDYVDPKGRKPVAYTKVMKKYKITPEMAQEEAGKFNITINPQHFIAPDAEGTKRGRPSKGDKPQKEKGVKGRPKKTKKVLQIEGEDDDLFATLVAEANDVEDVIVPKKKGKTEEEKEAERLAAENAKAEKEAKRLAEKAERDAKLAAEKAAKEAAKEVERLAREAKKKAEEEEKAAKKLAAEQAKALKEAEKAAKEAAKEAAKAEKSKKTTSTTAPVAKAAPQVEEKEDDEPDVVKKIEFGGKKYLKSKKTGIVYDYQKYVKEGDQVVIGKWNDATNNIDFTEEEEQEEEYDL